MKRVLVSRTFLSGLGESPCAAFASVDRVSVLEAAFWSSGALRFPGCRLVVRCGGWPAAPAAVVLAGRFGYPIRRVAAVFRPWCRRPKRPPAPRFRYVVGGGSCCYQRTFPCARNRRLLAGAAYAFWNQLLSCCWTLGSELQLERLLARQPELVAGPVVAAVAPISARRRAASPRAACRASRRSLPARRAGRRRLGGSRPGFRSTRSARASRRRSSCPCPSRARSAR